MRIIAGKHKGRRIEMNKDVLQHIRPTSDFAREAIFNILTHSNHSRNGESFIKQRVLDVFCGTGAFGLEALSRGAGHVTFIDQSRDALATARHNTQRFNELEHADFMLANATRLGKSKAPYSLIFLDPPYFGKMIAPALQGLKNGHWMSDGSLIIIEHDAKEDIPLPEGFTVLDERRYGRALIKLIRQSSAA